MPTVRGQYGYLATGGYLWSGTPLVDGAVAEGGTTLHLKVAVGQRLMGNVADGDTFTVAGVSGTYTVAMPAWRTSSPTTWHIRAKANRVIAIPFTPAAPVGGFPDGAAVTFGDRLMAQLLRWQLTRRQRVLPTTVMRDKHRSYRPGQPDWFSTADALFDYGDAEQAALVQELLAATIDDGVVAFLTLGAEEIPRRDDPWTEQWEPDTEYTPFWLAESALIPQAQIVAQVDELVRVNFTFQSRERRGAEIFTERWEYSTTLTAVFRWREAWES